MTVVAPKLNGVNVIVARTEFKTTEALLVRGEALFEGGAIEKAEVTILESTAEGVRLEKGMLRADKSGIVTLIAKYNNEVSGSVQIVVLPEPLVAFEFSNRTSFYLDESIALSAKTTPTNATINNISFSIDGANTIGANIENNVLTATSSGWVNVKLTINEKSLIQAFYAAAIENIVDINDITLETTAFKTSEVLELVATTSSHDSTANIMFAIVDDGGTNARLENSQLTAKKVGTITLRVYTSKFSKTIDINVDKEPVKAILFNSKDRFKVTQSLELTATVLPSNATNKNVQYSIKSAPEQMKASIKNNVLTANAVGEITLIMVADGVIQEVIITVAKEPVTAVKFNSKDVFKITEFLLLSVTVLPTNSTNRDVTFKICDEETAALGAKIENNILTASGEGKITILMIDGDSKVFKTVVTAIREVVTSIDLHMKVESINDTKGEFRTSGRLHLNPLVYPLNATNRQLEIAIDDSRGIGARFCIDCPACVDCDSCVTCKAFRDMKTITVTPGAHDIYLRAALPGEVKIIITAQDNNYLSATYVVEVKEEAVARIHIGFTQSAASGAATEAQQGELSSGKLIDTITKEEYFEYDELYLVSKGASEIARMGCKILAYAEDKAVEPSFVDDYSLLFYDSLEDLQKDKKSTVIKCTFEGGFIKENSILGAVWIVAVSDHGRDAYGNQAQVKSIPLKLNIVHPNIDVLKNLHVDSATGTIDEVTGEKGSNIPGVLGYKIEVKSGNTIEFSTTILTNIMRMHLRLFKYSLPDYQVSVELILDSFVGKEDERNGYNESYFLKIDTQDFHGIIKTPREQLSDHLVDGNDYSEVLLYDLGESNQTYNKTIKLNKNLRYLYIYGNKASHSGLSFAEENTKLTNDLHITLDSISFTAQNGCDALSTARNSNISLDVIGKVTLRGGDGYNGSKGENGVSYGYFSPAAEGEKGVSGEITWIAWNKPDGGVGKAGENGNNGGAGINGEHGQNGGNAIVIESGILEVLHSESLKDRLTLIGGDGGNGGKGGDGGKGQRGGKGGRGGDASLRWVVVAAVAGNGGRGGIGGNGGNGGDGGKGGNAGRGGQGCNVAIECTQITGLSGSAGKGGKGGEAGFLGNGGKGGSAVVGIMLGVKYDGKNGAVGTLGKIGKSGSAGADGVLNS